MSAAASSTAEAAEAQGADAPAKGGRKKLLLLAAPVVLLLAGAGLWFGGILPGLLGMGRHEAEAPAGPAPIVPGYFELPEILVNLNAPGRRPAYMKLRAKLELADARDAERLREALPRLLDLFNTYMREVRPEELRGSSGTHRLREELAARAAIAAAPVKITDVLFIEMLVQ